MHGEPQERELGARTVQLFPIFHPAAGLRTPAVKEQLREDFAKLPALLAEPVPQEPAPEAGSADDGRARPLRATTSSACSASRPGFARQSGKDRTARQNGRR